MTIVRKTFAFPYYDAYVRAPTKTLKVVSHAPSAKTAREQSKDWKTVGPIVLKKGISRYKYARDIR